MIAVVTMRAMKGWQPVLRACLLGAMLSGVAMTGIAARSVLHRVEPFSRVDLNLEVAVLPSWIAAVIAAWLGALMAATSWEVRSCTYSWNVPRLLRAMNLEMAVLGFVIFGFAAGVGAALEGALVNASWSLAIAASLGYAAGANFMMPRGLVGGGYALLPVVAVFAAMPEVVWTAHRIGLLGALAALGVMIALIARAHRDVLTRDRLGARGEWLEAVGPDARLYGRRDPFISASARDARGLRGVRRSDREWLEALIHEVHGEARGGLLGTGARWALVMLAMGLLVQAYLHAIRSQLPADTASTLLPVAMVMSMMVVSAPVLPTPGVDRPLSRRRLARLVWSRTQVEEFVMFAAVMIAFVAVAIVIDLFVAVDAWAALGWWTQTLLAAFALLPFARWIRLHTIDGDPRVARSTGAAIFPGYIAGQAATMCLLLFGSWGVVVGWHDLTDRLEAFAPVWTFGAWGGALLVAAACRWWWLLALRRFLERRDLVAV